MQTFNLDISNKGVYPILNAKQGEVGRKFLAVITDNGVPYSIPDDALLSVWYEGETDAGNYSSINEESAFSINGNQVTVELAAQMLLKPDSGNLCLSVSRGNGEEVNTWNIQYRVEHKPGAGSAVPTEYFTALTEVAALAAEQVTTAKNAAKAAAGYTATAQQAADSAAESAADAASAAETAVGEVVSGFVRKDGSVPMTGPLNMNANTVTGLSAPTSDTDAMPLGYWKSNRPFLITTIIDQTLKDPTFKTGFYRVTNKSMTLADMDWPFTSSGTMLVLNFLDSAVIQIAFLHEGTAKLRSHFYGTWYDWKTL